MDGKAKDRIVPLYTKVGSIVAWAAMAIIVVMILRNCVNSVVYGTKTKPLEITQFYDRGVEDGKAQKTNRPDDQAFENPVLLKSYNKGYRVGLDIVKVGAVAD